MIKRMVKRSIAPAPAYHRHLLPDLAIDICHRESIPTEVPNTDQTKNYMEWPDTVSM